MEMEEDNWFETENKFQEQYGKVNIPYKSYIVLRIHVIRGRNISVGYYSDMLDTPDGQLHLSCLSSFFNKLYKTHMVLNDPNPEWDDHFTFVIGREKKLSAENKWVKIEAKLYDVDRMRRDDYLGQQEVDLTDLEVGQEKKITLSFATHGEVDIAVQKEIKGTPDLRLSHNLCEPEMNFRKMRKYKVMSILQKVLGEDGPKSLEETPTISIASSGGGYRAMIASAGFMEALYELEIFQATMYWASLSGSSWYMSMSYMEKAYESMESLIACNNKLQTRCETNLIKAMISKEFAKRYLEHRKIKGKEDRPITAVDLFGFAVGWSVFGREHFHKRLSETRECVEQASVPFHMLTAVHVRDKLPVAKFNVGIEMNAFEISAPLHGIHVPTELYNSDWSHGIVLRKLPELPLHYHVGTAGSAFAILISYIEYGSEASGTVWKEMEELSLKIKAGALELEDSIEEKIMPVTSAEVGSSVDPGRSNEVSLNESDSDGDDELEMNTTAAMKRRATEEELTTTDGDEEEEKCPSVMEMISKNTKGRGVLLKRAAKVLNFTYQLPKLINYSLNPLTKRLSKSEIKTGSARSISRKSKTIQMIDAGIACNVPSEYVLRPQRTTDILIVLDAGNHKQEGELNFMTLINAAQRAKEEGLKFPKFKKEKILKESFKDLYVIEDEDGDPECPVVLWFTLSNKEFCRVEDYTPVHGQPTKGEDGKPFNSFKVPFRDQYSTYHFNYTPLDYDRLRELCRFNILRNKEILLGTISERIRQKRKGLRK